jgi:translation initiation factor IF-2
VLQLTEFVTANDLANMMNVSVTNVISTCMSLGVMVAINQRLDAETINIVAEEYGYKTQFVSADVIEAIAEVKDAPEDLIPRPPIVTVMGHVDHGKTSLLDSIRSTNVIAGEAGGITQHIGAYNVRLEDGRKITFLDTPGHEAFTAMRARGAKVTDVAIIIVAADDNVMPQTVEAINHAGAAGVPIVFAINKIDKPGANPEKIKEKLAEMNYLVEDWGGKYQSQDISAKKGTGIRELLEKVLLEADLLELKANPNRRASGSIIESSLDKGRGYVATVLVENGTLRQGDIVIAGSYFGRVKAMFNERNQRNEEAGPAEPALILGLNGAPQAGDTFNVMETEQEARSITNRREQLQREQSLRTQKMLTLDDIGRRIAIGNFQQLNIIVKGDVDGSVEALSDSLIRLSTEEIQVNVIHKAVGQISESDVTLAAASDAIIIGFQVRPSLGARKEAEKEGIDIRLYSIIYDAIEEVKAAMEGMLSPDIKEDITGNVEVLDVFKITKVGTVAGCMVRDGKIKRSSRIRLVRDGIVIYTGELDSLKRFKEDVKEVTSGYECGITIRHFNDMKVGDIIEAYEETEVKKTL